MNYHCSFVQAVAACQAGVSVIQPNIGRLSDWYRLHPGFIRDPKGPREDSGFAAEVNPGVLLVERLYNYAKQLHPKTRIMVRPSKDEFKFAGRWCKSFGFAAGVWYQKERR